MIRSQKCIVKFENRHKYFTLICIIQTLLSHKLQKIKLRLKGKNVIDHGCGWNKIPIDIQVTLGARPANSPDTPFSAITNLKICLTASLFDETNIIPTLSFPMCQDWPQKYPPEEKYSREIKRMLLKSCQPWPALSGSWPHPEVWSLQQKSHQQQHHTRRLARA